MQKSQTNITASQDNNNQITFLPGEKIVSIESVSIMKAHIKEQEINLKQFYSAISFLEKLDYIGEIIQFGVNHITTIKQKQEREEEGKIVELMMAEVFRKFEHLEYSNHKLFRNDKVLKTKDPKKFIYKIPSLDLDNRMREEEKLGKSDNKFEKICAMRDVLAASIMNNSINTTSNIIKDLFKDSKEILASISTENQENYQIALFIINSAIQCIESKFQLKPIMVLKEHLKESCFALVHASKVLIDNNRYEEAIELLEPKLLNITSADKIIAQCMYNLGLSYMAIGNYEKAEQYFINSSAVLPKNDLDLIMNLYDIYIATDRIAEAKELLINISSKDIKDYLTLSLAIDKITPKKLATINKKNLPFNLLQNYKYY